MKLVFLNLNNDFTETKMQLDNIVDIELDVLKCHF